MEKTILEKTQHTLEETLTKHKTLMDLLEKLRERLRKVQEEQATVPDKIYQKVKGEYEQQLADVEAELGPIQENITSLQKTTINQLSSLESDLEVLEDQYSEVVFRHRVGEYDGEKLGEIEQSILPQIEEKRMHKEPLIKILEQIDSTVDLESSGGQKKKHEESRIDVSRSVSENPAASDKNEDFISKFADPADDQSNSGFADAQEESLADPSLDNLADFYNEYPADNSQNNSSNPPPENGNSKGSVGKTDPKSEELTITFPNLIFTSGSQAGKKIPLLPMTMTIGREHDNNIELKDEEVARYHAKILYQDGLFILQDLNSSTGTWVNDDQITEVTLKNSDKIRLGKVEMVIDFN